jgi:hypothetical protein
MGRNGPNHRDEDPDDVTRVQSFLPEVGREGYGAERDDGGLTLKRVKPRMRIMMVLRCPRT